MTINIILQEPVDFLRQTDTSRRGHRDAVQSLDLDRVSPIKKEKWLVPNQLKKTISMPPTQASQLSEVALREGSSLTKDKALRGLEPEMTITENKPYVSQEGVGCNALTGQVSDASLEMEERPAPSRGSTIGTIVSVESSKESLNQAPPSPFS